MPALLLVLLLAAASVAPLSADDWPSWRGPLGTGEARAGNPPIEFSETV